MSEEEMIEPRWEFNCAQFIDFKQPNVEDTNSSDEWFDMDHENDSQRRIISTNPRAFPLLKMPLKEINVELNKANRWPANTTTATNCEVKKVDVPHRSYHMKTRLSAGRQTELNRRSVNKAAKQTRRLSTSSSISSKSSSSHAKKTTESDDNEANFFDSLRRYDSPDPNKKFVCRATVPVPFNFSRPPTQKAVVDEFRSIAQQVIAYQTTTPLRFRMRPRRASTGDGKASRLGVTLSTYSVKRLCVPRSPVLETKNRKRDQHIQSQLELEEEQVQKMKNYHFQANPFKEEIYRKSYCGVPEKHPKQSTVAKPFHFHVNIPAKPPQVPSHEVSSSFRARPIPNELFQRPLGIPNVPKRRAVALQPFTFDELDRERLRKKEQKINEVYEEEKRLREFRANPLPSLEVKGVPEKQPKPKTTVQPFDFLANQRELHTLEKKRFAAEMQRINEVVKFKAKRVSNNSPFIPQKPSRFLTCVAPPTLYTTQRAAEREGFNQRLKEKEERKLAQEEMFRLQREEEDMKELALLRERIVHKAQPMRLYKAPERPPSIEPTEPITPMCLKRTLKKPSEEDM